MAKALPPTDKKLGIRCGPLCKFHPNKIGWEKAEKLAEARARGAGIIVFSRLVEELLGYKPNRSSTQRHLSSHYVREADPVPEKPSGKPTDLEILDAVIESGFHNSKNWRPTIKDTMEAMKLKMQMTGNSAFNDLIALFDVDDDDEESNEAVEALLSPDERPDEGDSELEEPLAGE